MPMDEKQIVAVARVLADWNPLGSRADTVKDLDGYRTEAIDVIMALNFRPTITAAVRDVLNGAFKLSLQSADCFVAAERIATIVGNKRPIA